MMFYYENAPASFDVFNMSRTKYTNEELIVRVPSKRHDKDIKEPANIYIIDSSE